MTIRLIVLCIFNLISGCANCQITFQKLFGETTAATAQSIQQTTDGGFIIGGQSGINLFDFCLVKTDDSGAVEWTKSFDSGADYDRCYSVCQTLDGGFIMAGEATFQSLDNYIFVVKTNSLGDTAWTKLYTVSGGEHIYDILQTFDGGFILTGNTYDSVNYNSNIFLLKIDSLGTVLWSHSFGASYHEYGLNTLQLSDSGYIVVGNTDLLVSDIIVLRLSSNGILLWATAYNSFDHIYADGIIHSGDGGYIIFGTWQIYLGQNYLAALKIDSVGNLLWAKKYGNGGGFDFAADAQRTFDKGFVISGFTSSFADSLGDIYLLKIDSSGLVTWSKTYGGLYEDYSWSVKQTTDSGFVVTGWSNGLGIAGWSDIYTVKTSPYGISGCNENLVQTTVNQITISSSVPILSAYNLLTISTNPVVNVYIRGIELNLCSSVGANNELLLNTKSSFIYPNPASSYFKFQAEFNINSIEVFNVLGEKQVLSASNLDTNLFSVDGFKDGVYFVRVTLENNYIIHRLIIQ